MNKSLLPKWRNCEQCDGLYFGYKNICPQCEKKLDAEYKEKEKDCDSQPMSFPDFIQENGFVPNKEGEESSWNEDKYEMNEIIEQEIKTDITNHLRNGFKEFGIEGTLEKIEKLSEGLIKDRFLKAFDLIVRR